ncbi:MAG: ThuA domain-containing protein [Armatimonadetes bacterium]|nr:ThuA domain-containing protein [Armatimonadota bacterium]
MGKRALIVWGGWDGHFPRELSVLFDQMLAGEGFEVVVENTLDAFCALDLSTFDLIVPIWTMGQISGEQLAPLCAAVESGVGLAGVHGGMCDAFRDATDYQFMTGGQWVAHPGGGDVTYTVNITQPGHVICAGVEDFSVTSEQYYLHVDPGVDVLATTVFESVGGVVMPVTWTKTWGQGRVFYCSVGHKPADIELPMMQRMCRQGFLWAAR